MAVTKRCEEMAEDPAHRAAEVQVPDDLSQVLSSPGYLALQSLFPHDEFPEDTFADRFLPGYQRPKEPIPEDVWRNMACEANAGRK